MKLALSGIYLFFGEQTFESVMARRKNYLMPRSRRLVLLAYCLLFWPLVHAWRGIRRKRKQWKWTK